jgi:hypothetical protein
MAGKKRRFFAVAKGRSVGVFFQYWDEVEPLVSGFPGAIFKGFDNSDQAHLFLQRAQEKRGHAEPHLPDGDDPSSCRTMPAAAAACGFSGSRVGTRAASPPGRQLFFAVARGFNPGVYLTADEAARQVQGYHNPLTELFESFPEAQAFVDRHRPRSNADVEVMRRKPRVKEEPWERPEMRERDAVIYFISAATATLLPMDAGAPPCDDKAAAAAPTRCAAAFGSVGLEPGLDEKGGEFAAPIDHLDAVPGHEADRAVLVGVIAILRGEVARDKTLAQRAKDEHRFTEFPRRLVMVVDNEYVVRGATVDVVRWLDTRFADAPPHAIADKTLWAELFTLRKTRQRACMEAAKRLGCAGCSSPAATSSPSPFLPPAWADCDTAEAVARCAASMTMFVRPRAGDDTDSYFLQSCRFRAAAVATTMRNQTF